jgi:hypothetical protein
VGSADLPSLLVASLDLKLVQLVRGAMANADAASGKGTAVSGLGPAPSRIERRFRVQPETEILPRRRVEPEPRIEPRQVIRPADRYEPRVCDAVPAVYECYTPHTKSPIEPPWKVLPWEDRSQCEELRPQIKVVIKPPDIVHRGSIIDYFI